jgi:hypothetical protein
MAGLALRLVGVRRVVGARHGSLPRIGFSWNRAGRPRFGVIWHGDDWGRSHQHGWQWRSGRFDRGYCRNGVWITF